MCFEIVCSQIHLSSDNVGHFVSLDVVSANCIHEYVCMCGYQVCRCVCVVTMCVCVVTMCVGVVTMCVCVVTMCVGCLLYTSDAADE